MAKIPLRTYIKEIENQIERGEIEQAVAHAKNILKSYPKNIDTYRLLGKAFLESQHYSEAADILQRVLSVIPDDFISQIGMSIIREDEGNLDASIWHMERAYEVQPFNPAVQEELRRLYGRRDGIEPPKIRLTRGALVRMYTRGELFTQAIAETRAALAEDPQRMDLLVLLARLYYMSGQKNDAAEVCSELIRKLPYCLEANKLLAEFLPETNRAEEAQKFLQRIYALDPYTAFISPTTPTSDQVPDQAVMVEQFTWESAMEEAQTPAWTRNIGVEWEESKEEMLPDWLNTLKPEASSTATTAPEITGYAQEPEPGEIQEGSEPGKGDLIPDWMKDAGWIPSDRKADEVMASQPQPEEEEIAPADLPDWVQSIAPKDIGPAAEEEERTGWLDTILSEQGDNGIETGIVPPPAFEKDETQQGLPDWVANAGTGTQMPGSTDLPVDNLPDWFTQMEEEKPLGEGETLATGEMKPAEFEGLPDWSQLGEPSTTETAPDAGTTSDWLRSFEAPAAETPSATEQAPDWIQSVESGTPEKAEEPTELTDWLQSSAGEAGEKSEEPTGLTDWLQSVEPEELEKAEESGGLTDWLTSAGAGTPEKAGEPSGLTDWLQSVEPEKKENAEESSGLTDWMASAGDELPEKAEETTEIPEWLQSAGQEISEKSEDSAGVTGWMESGQAETAEPKPAVEAEIPDWLKSMAKEEDAVIEPLETAPQETVEMPTDVQSVETPPVLSFEEPVSAEPAAEVETPPASTAPEGAPDFSDMDSAMAWLESLAAKQGADEATLVTPPEQRLEQPPDWVTKEMETQEPAVPEVEMELPEVAETVEEQAATLAQANEPAQATEELPDWLKSAEAEVEIPSQVAESADSLELPVLEETLSAPVEPGVEMPEWLQEGKAETFEQTAQTTPTAEVAIQTDAAPGSAPDFSDMDAAMAWLESLAAKQGAEEATLVTPLEQRLEQPPEWVTKEMESAEGIQPVAEIESQPAIEEPALPEPAQDQVPAWLQPEEETTPAEQIETAPVTAEQVAQPEAAPGSVPDFSDMDAAMAWLESLAAKQGADEATLVTPPEQRLEQPPEWVTKEVEAEAAMSVDQLPEVSEEPETPGPLATEYTAEEELAPAEDAVLPDWLQDAIKEDMPAIGSIETPVDEPAVEIELPEPEPAAEVPEIEAPVMGAPVVEEPEVVLPAGEEPAVVVPSIETQAVPSTEMDMDAAFAWLESLAEKQGADEGTLVTSPEERLETPPEWVQEQALEAETLPEAETLSEAEIETEPAVGEPLLVESEAQLEEPLAVDQLPGEPPAEETAQSSEEEAVPDWLSSIGQDELAETAVSEETQPWSGETETAAEHAAAVEPIPDWLQAPAEPVTSAATGTESEKVPDWLMNLEEESEHEEFPKEVEIPPVPGDFSSAWEPEVEISEATTRVPAEQAAVSGSLNEIQTALGHGDLDQALAGYNSMIQNGEHLEETIHDLRDALYRYPVDISIWQTLGDAYARNNQLQDALDAYTKAEELLR